MARQGARDDDGRARGGRLRAAGHRDADAVRRLRARSTPRAATTTPPRRRSGRLPPLAEGDATAVRRRHADPALHRAAAALHRGDADQGARGARHRPAVDVRRDDLDDRRPRLRPGRGAPAPPGAGRRDRDGPARRALRRLRRPRSSPPGWRRSSTRSPAASAPGCRCCAPSTTRSAPRRREAQGAQARATSRPRRPTRSAREGHPMVIRLGRNGRFLACSLYPEHKETRPLPGDEAPQARGRRRDLPAVRRGDARRRSAAGSGRSSAARATRTARTSGRTARRRPTRCRSRSTCPKNGDGHLVARRARRTGNVFWGCSNYPKCDFTTNDEPLGAVHDADDGGPVARKGETGICLTCGADVAAAGRQRSSAPGCRAGRRTRRRSRGRRAVAAARRVRRAAARRPARRTGRGRLDAIRRGLGVRDRAPARERRRGAGADRRGRGGVTSPDAALRRFLRSLAARDASPNTQRSYETAVGAYLDWLDARGVDWRTPGADRPARLPRRAARGPRADVGRPAARRDPLVPPLGARTGLAAGDPWGAIATPRLPRRLPRVLEVDQVERAARRRRRGARPRRRGGRRVHGHGRGRMSRPRAGHRAPRPGARRDGLRGRPADQRARRRGPRLPRPAARRDPGPRQGPQGADRAARRGRPARRSRAYLEDGRPVARAPRARRGRRRRRRPSS